MRADRRATTAAPRASTMPADLVLIAAGFVGPELDALGLDDERSPHLARHAVGGADWRVTVPRGIRRSSPAATRCGARASSSGPSPRVAAPRRRWTPTCVDGRARCPRPSSPTPLVVSGAAVADFVASRQRLRGGPVKSTMQDAPLLISGIIRHGEAIYAEKRVFTVTPDGVEEATFFQIAERAEQLAAALTRLGVAPGDRVATFMWNNQAHMEAYFAVPSMGAVLHTLNIRLFPEQLAYIINHAEDKVIIVDALPGAGAREGPRPDSRRRRHIIVHGADDDGRARRDARLRDARWRPSGPASSGPNSTNATPRSCVTPRARPATPRASSTRTAPRGCTRWRRRAPTRSGSSERDRCLLIVPMFHVNAWGARLHRASSPASS